MEEWAQLAKKPLYTDRALFRPVIIAVCHLVLPDHQPGLAYSIYPGFHNQSTQGGNPTPKTVNSLAAIAGNEGDEEPWKFDAYDVDEEEVLLRLLYF